MTHDDLQQTALTLLVEGVEVIGAQRIGGDAMALKDGVHRLVGELDLLMVKKYGTIPTWAQTRLDQAGPEQLETWADAILEAETLEALLGETPRH